jgi:hypothetical protein
VVPLAHASHSVPPLPHAPSLVPLSHVDPVQHPAHDVPSHTQRPSSHRCPAPHVPLVQAPPQPSLAPHALPAQLGTQPQTPVAPPPPHVSGGAQPPAQHGCPLPPQVPQLTPHTVPLPHGAHATPPPPHALALVPLAHVVPLQHPLHDVGSHVQTPNTQCSPVPQLPSVHTPAQPSLAPQDLPSQLAVHAPTPHTLGVPAPPHAWPMLQPPQSTSVPHASISPQWPAHASFVVHVMSTPVASTADPSAPASMT